VVLLAEHWPHAPDGSHAGVEPPQSASPPQPRQACRLPSQIGAVALLQSALARLTQVPLGTSQAGMLPVQRILLVAEQIPQAPDGWQAGVAPVPQSPSPPQPRQVCVLPSQTGVVPEQSALARQWTQDPAGT